MPAACRAAHRQVMCRGTVGRRIGDAGEKKTWWESPCLFSFFYRNVPRRRHVGEKKTWWTGRGDNQIVTDVDGEEGAVGALEMVL